MCDDEGKCWCSERSIDWDDIKGMLPSRCDLGLKVCQGTCHSLGFRDGVCHRDSRVPIFILDFWFNSSKNVSNFRVANALRNESVPANSPFALPKAPADWIANVAAMDPDNALDGTASAFPRLSHKLQNALQYL